jgi:hypothetical protein
MGERTGSVALQAGMHLFDLGYFQGCCGIGLMLELDAPGRPRGPIPAWWLFHEAPAPLHPRGARPGPGRSPVQAALNRAA